MTTSSSSPEGGRGAASDARLARVVGVKESLVTIDVADTRVMKNEVGFVLLDEQRLRARIIELRPRAVDKGWGSVRRRDDLPDA